MWPPGWTDARDLLAAWWPRRSGKHHTSRHFARRAAVARRCLPASRGHVARNHQALFLQAALLISLSRQKDLEQCLEKEWKRHQLYPMGCLVQPAHQVRSSLKLILYPSPQILPFFPGGTGPGRTMPICSISAAIAMLYFGRSWV